MSLQNELKCLAIAITPPRYFSLPKSLNTKTGSFPDFPKASQKIYSSMIVSPITKTLISSKFFKIFLIFSKLKFFFIFDIKSF